MIKNSDQIESQEENNSILSVEKLTKLFGNVVANDEITFNILKGEIHCLLGENGAGKTTLAECLYGSYFIDSGDIYFDGKKVNISSSYDAIRLGIGMVHQHFTLVRPLSVVENIVVGTKAANIILDLNDAKRQLEGLCNKYGINIDLTAKVWQLSIGEQQWVEILKILFYGVKLLILDEPTAVLTPQEVEKLFEILIKFKAEGLSILLITHKLDEILAISDRVTVLREGKKVDTVNTKEVTKAGLANLMVGREVVFHVEKEGGNFGDPILEIHDLHVLSDRGLNALDGTNLTIRRGEILGLAGVAGNGQKELFESIIGVRKIDNGKITLDGNNVTHETPQSISAKGIAHIPEDRLREGLIPDFSLAENLILGHHKQRFFRHGIYIAEQEVSSYAKECIKEFSIVTPSINQKTRNLSGGNLQKVILARELSAQPKCLIANQPTRGLDIAATEYIHRRILDQRAKGVGILLISEDLDEIISLSDRVGVIYKGRIVSIIESGLGNKARIGLLMAGILSDE